MTHRGFTRTIPLIALVVLLAFSTVLTTPAWSQQSSSEGGNASSAGMQALSGLSTLVYLPVKAAFAIAGGIVGGLTYAFTAGNETAAKSVWTTSMYGTYIITPEHLNGDKAIRFLGVADTESPTPSTAPAPEPVR
ncbi:MAG: hypothetical protein U0412_00470 [Nitrospira sp.]